ncbi:amino acid/polyamine transporter I [Dactylonectria macrodidyma]|uniref:Amino acid/polyamine transporter I n=1 Tax=Dactylonectria macrodidyma TaxID=307937 RepID=A0A9P9JF52_9HYPO|nr:amino acid/polyamine transporter I [Dactylonectria macrodidyma]
MKKDCSPDMKSVEVDNPQLESNGSIKSGKVEENLELSRLGIDSYTKRDLSLISIVALGWNICNSWAAIGATMSLSIASGGPVTLLYGLLLIVVLNGSAAATMAEIASVYPTAGGQYHWTGILAPKKWSRGLSYCCGTINLLGWIATAAGFVVTTAQLVTGIATFMHPTYSIQSWHVFLIFQLMNIMFVLYNMYLIKRTLWIHDIGFAISLVSFLVILVTCLARSETKQTDAFVWGNFVNPSGWSADGVVFLIGLSNPNFIYSGLDGAVHLAEECTDAARTVPKALMSTIVVGFITGFSFAIAMTYCTIDFDAAMAAPIPILEIWYQATRSKAAAVTFTSVLAICGCFAIIGCHQTASRLTYSFARDNALFFSPKLSTISEIQGVPMFALLANGIVVAIIGFVYLGSTTAFNAMVSTGLILLQVSFAFPAALLLWRKRSVRFLPKNRPFRLGPFGWVVNFLAIVFAFVALIFYSLPTVLPVTSSNMNYACAVIGVMLIFGLINWFGYASKHYRGPSMEDI